MFQKKRKKKDFKIIKKIHARSSKKAWQFSTKTKESIISTIFEKKKNCSSELYLQLSLKCFVILGLILNKFFKKLKKKYYSYRQYWDKYLQAWKG